MQQSGVASGGKLARSLKSAAAAHARLLRTYTHHTQILVQRVHEGSPAAASRLIQVGDRLKACSAVFGEEMWEVTDVQRTRWAISNRAGKVKVRLGGLLSFGCCSCAVDSRVRLFSSVPDTAAPLTQLPPSLPHSAAAGV